MEQVPAPLPTQPQAPPQPRPPAVPWTVRDVCLGAATLLLWIALSLGLGLLMRYVVPELDMGLVLTLLEVVLLLPAWWFTVRKYRLDWGALGLRRFRPGMLGLGLALMLLAYAFNMFHNLVLLLLGLDILPDYAGLFERMSPWLVVLATVVVAPLAEEVFFRGFVFAGLRERLGWWRAALISAAIFSLVHLSPATILPIFVLGCFLAFLYDYSKSLWPAILVHATVNGLSLAAVYLLMPWIAERVP